MQQQLAPSPQAKTRRQRSPVERGLVWGFILALYLVVVFEWRAKYGYEKASEAIVAAVKASDDTGEPLTLDEAKRIMDKDSSSEEADTYHASKVWLYTWRWRSLFKSYTIVLTMCIRSWTRRTITIRRCGSIA